jgi:chromosome segregation ATPase
VRQSRSELEAQLETANTERSQLYSQLSEFQSQTETANQNQNQLQSQISELEQQLESVRQSRSELEAQLTSQISAIPKSNGDSKPESKSTSISSSRLRTTVRKCASKSL